MAEKQYKRVGWIVEFTSYGSRDNWHSFGNGFADTKSKAILNFNERCQFFHLRKSTKVNGRQYIILKRRGTARCVPLYVEVSDE